MSSYRGNRLTNTQKPRQDRLQYTVLQLQLTTPPNNAAMPFTALTPVVITR